VNKAKRIGVLGGTFDPVHNAHLAMARAARDHARLDAVLFVVAARPPHKDTGPCASPEDRFNMVEAAVADEPQLRASPLELDRGGVSYTCDTLDELGRQAPAAKLFLVVGFDSLIDLPNWRNFQHVVASAGLLVAPRPGQYNHVPKELEGRYTVLPCPKFDVSSTDIRNRIRAGQSIEDLVPPAVVQYIREKGIYQ